MIFHIGDFHCTLWGKKYLFDFSYWGDKVWFTFWWAYDIHSGCGVYLLAKRQK